MAANQIFWATIKTKLADVLKTFSEAIDAAVLAAFAKTINTDADESNSMAGSLAFADSELTIATGAVTAKRSYHTIDTQSDSSPDDLDTIATGSVGDGCILIIAANNAARTVICKHEAGGAGQLHLAGGKDYTMDDGNKRLFLQRDGADWYEVSRHAPNVALQVVNVKDGAVNTGSVAFPIDNTTPQNDEGDQFMSKAITPTNTNNLLRIEVTFIGALSVSNSALGVGLFQDTTANALTAAGSTPKVADELHAITFTHWMTAGTVAATTFKVRAGGASGVCTFNGVNTGQLFNTLMASSITITEYAA